MRATRELTRRLETGQLTCVGPKHFPAREYLGKSGWARRIAGELRVPGDLEGLEAVVDRLSAIRVRCGERFRIGIFGRSFLRIVQDLGGKRGAHAPSRDFRLFVQALLARKEGRKRVNRLRKLPQLENLLRFLGVLARCR